MKVLVCGGRDFGDYDLVESALDALSAEVEIAELMHGAATGADSLAARWAQSMEIEATPYPARWFKYGKEAGPRRNQEMIDDGPDLVVAFPGGAGTADLVRRAEKAGIEVRRIA